MNSGVYQIINLINNKIYIGSAIDFESRFKRHKNSLQKGKHHSILLQRAWNKYGGENFEFKPFLYCSKESKYEVEQFCMDTLKPEYNISKIARGVDVNSKPISQYSLNGEFIRDWISSEEAGRNLGLKGKTIGNCLLGYGKTAGGYKWGYKDKGVSIFEKGKRQYIKKVNPRENVKQRVAQYSANNELIEIFPSIVEAAFKTNCGVSGIGGCLNGTTVTHHGFIWRYVDRETPPFKGKRINRPRKKNYWTIPIIQLDLIGNVVEEFQSIGEASEKTGIKAKYISLNLGGRTKTGKGYLWKYKNKETKLYSSNKKEKK